MAIIEVLEYHPELWHDPLKPSYFLIILTGLEVIVVLIALIRYLSKIVIRTESSIVSFGSSHRSTDNRIQ